MFSRYLSISSVYLFIYINNTVLIIASIYSVILIIPCKLNSSKIEKTFIISTRTPSPLALELSKIFCSKIVIFSQILSIFRWNKIGRTDDKFIITSQSFLSSDIAPTSSKRKRRIFVYGVGHSLWSAISCQRNVVKSRHFVCEICKMFIPNWH